MEQRGAAFGEEAQDEEPECLRTLDIPLFVEGDDESALRTQNLSMSDYERNNVIERNQGAIHTRCELLDVIHGSFSEAKDSFATLMIFKFRFDPQKQSRRVRRARIGMEFFSATKTGATPVVYAIAPDERWTIAPTTDHEESQRSGSLTLGAPSILPVNLSATVSLQKTITRDISDVTTITGSINLGEGRNSGTSNCAAWNILENKRRETGVPDAVQLAVLLSRKDNERFNGIMTLDIVADFNSSISEKLRNRKGPAGRPGLVQPRARPRHQNENAVTMNPVLAMNGAALDASEKSEAQSPGAAGEKAERSILGLQIEFTPKTMLNSSDVVAIHGISQDFRKSWEGDAEESDSPARPTWLESSFDDKPVRLLSYSYYDFDRITGAAYACTRSNILYHAQALMDGLVELRAGTNEVPSRPIVFVSHDIGGVIVKAAIVLASRSPKKFSAILPAIRSLVFFGYPHRSNDRLELEAQLTQLLRLGDTPYPPAHITGLARCLAEVIDETNAAFIHTKMLIQAYVTNVFSDGSSIVQPVFNVFTTTLATPFENRVASNVSHQDLAKFGKPGQVFIKALSKANRTCGEFDSPGITLALSSIVQQAPPMIIHVRGDSDNDTLAASVVYDILTAAPEISSYNAMHFYFRRNDCRFDNIRAMLASFVATFSHHLIRDLQGLIAEVLERPTHIQGYADDDLLHLWGIFRDSLRLKPVFVLSGLDQCDDSVHWFLPELVKILQGSTNLFKMLITTTKGTDKHIVSSLSGLSEDGIYKQSHAETIPGYSPMTPFELAMLLNEHPRHQAYELQIKDVFSRCASIDVSRLFLLWLRSTVCSIDGALRELSTAPVVSPELVMEANLTSIPAEQHVWADTLLSWTLCSMRPLRVRELCAVSRLETRGSGTEEGETGAAKAPAGGSIALDVAQIQGYLGGLLVVKDDEFYCGHSALRGWLQSRVTETEQGLPQRSYWYRSKTKRQRHLDIVSTSLQYLSQLAESVESSEPADVELYELPYAIEYWPEHYDQLEASVGVDSEAIISFGSVEEGISRLFNNRPVLSRWIDAYNSLTDPFTRILDDFKTATSVAAHFGLDTWVRKLGLTSRNASAALVQASIRGRETIVQRLLDDPELNYTPNLDDPFLHKAIEATATFGNYAIVKLILGRLVHVIPGEKLDKSYPSLNNLTSADLHSWDG
ncbi:hypothetical protein B0T22DRAFT_511190 [Podospora appendiculata]|uniref:Nephrocystin 3-like N-terminal domain-containing protein n=1 Tax=Podospora appendiculata TaxID=314037 RepID=A0AAE0X8M9_9PEZI|nr:hypothetical protein B0T22DRAFT_511190 [Podospora appendiculata]